MQDAPADIDGIDFGGLVLEETISKAAGGSAHICTALAGYIQVKGLESGGQLLAAAGDEAGASIDGEDSILGDFGGGFGDHLPIGAYLTGHDQALGLGAALGQAAFDEVLVNSDFWWHGLILGQSGAIYKGGPAPEGKMDDN